jgi:Tol biopolymer transport system component
VLTRFGSEPAWAPDASRLAFSNWDSIWTVKPNGSGLSPIPRLRNLRSVDGPVWSRDGTRIAFDSGDRTYVVNADGSKLNRQPLFRGTRGSWAPAWSPDGSRLVILGTSNRTGFALWVARSDGTGRRLVYRSRSAGIWSLPAWSPDGKLIAVGVGGTSYGGPQAILFFSPDGTPRGTLAAFTRTIAWQPLPR